MTKDGVIYISRITPADAGTSTSSEGMLSLMEDHPRGCGDKANLVMKLFFSVGSPPRMRGQV